MIRGAKRQRVDRVAVGLEQVKAAVRAKAVEQVRVAVPVKTVVPSKVVTLHKSKAMAQVRVAVPVRTVVPSKVVALRKSKAVGRGVVLGRARVATAMVVCVRAPVLGQKPALAHEAMRRAEARAVAEGKQGLLAGKW